MSDTMTRDLTPAELYVEQLRLEKMILDIGAKYPHVFATCQPEGARMIMDENLSTNKNYRVGDVTATTWRELIPLAEQVIANWKLTRHDSVIRKMAAAIIELTDEHMHCTETLLRGKGFSASEIAEHKATACERAGDMAGNAPFEVLA